MGGSGLDAASQIAVDGAGNAYLRGQGSLDFPLVNALSNVDEGGFLTKFDPQGQVVYSTFLGATGTTSLDIGRALAVDHLGNAYVTGRTGSAIFPVVKAFQESLSGDKDAFVTKLGPTGQAVYSTYLGGSGPDQGIDIAVDNSGNAYVTGRTESDNFPRVNSTSSYQGSQDIFVSKFNPDGTVAYSTYLGGGGSDQPYSLAADRSGNAVVTGGTDSFNFPLVSAFDNGAPSYCGWRVCTDGFVTKFGSTGQIVFSTYLGGSEDDYGYSIAVDNDGNAILTGVTGSSDFPLANAFNPNSGGGNLFIAKFGTDGVAKYSSYVGGVFKDTYGGFNLGIDGLGSAYVTGEDASQDVLVLKLNAQGQLIYSEHIGGSDIDFGTAIAVDNIGNAYVTGVTQSLDFPTQNAFQANLSCCTSVSTAGDAFVLKLRDIVSVQPDGLTFGGQLVTKPSAAREVTVTNISNEPITLGEVTLAGLNAEDFIASNPCNGVGLAQHANCTFSVIFKPTAVGTRSAVIQIRDNSSAILATVQLSGSGTVPAPSAPPTISSVSPNPVTGSNSAQPFTINGENFAEGANVVLRDLTTGEVFENRTPSSFSSDRIVIDPVFTTAAHSWSVEVINPAGGSTGQFPFLVIAGFTPPPGERPVYPAPPAPIEGPAGKPKFLIYLIHGWNSNPDAWAAAMRDSIIAYLKSGSPAVDSFGCKTVETVSTIWRVCTYDWHGDADTWLPWDAYVNAMDHGRDLATDLVDANYDFIQFIAHSSGSQVADTAATWISIYASKRKLTQPVLHATFLDAFDPAGAASPYGDKSDWAEQYLDARRVGTRLLDDTDLTLPRAYNFDITNLDLETTDVLGYHAHAWPYRWYLSTIDGPNTEYRYGFPLSKVAGANPTHNATHQRGHRCFASLVDKSCTESAFRKMLITVRSVGEDALKAYSLAKAITSPTGVVMLVADVLKLLTSSPVWVTLPIETTEPANVLTFDYAFPRKAEGILTLYFDGQLVYRADERVHEAGAVHRSGNVPIGDIPAGVHSLTFRLDGYGGIQSEADISHLQLARQELSPAVQPPPINQPPSADAGPDRSVKLGLTVNLDGTASRDPDVGPQALTFAWTQISGPSVFLTGAATATPVFKPELPGSYTFNLVVNDGAATSSPDQVKILVEDVPLWLRSPNGGEIWKIKQRQTIVWYRSPTLGDVRPRKKLSVQFSKNGGRKWTTLKQLKPSVSALAWKPNSAHRSEAARIRVCLPAVKKAPLICDASDSNFSIRK